MKKFLVITVCLTMFALMFSGCPGDNPVVPETDKFPVAFSLNGKSGAPPANQMVEKGKLAVRPSDPSVMGYQFVDWFETAVSDIEVDTATPFSFSTPITGPKTLYAGWKQDDGNYWFVKFYNGASVFMETAIDPAAPNPTVADTDLALWEMPGKAGSFFIGWFYDADNPGERFEFDTVITGNLNLYAVYGQASDVIKINSAKGYFTDDYNLGYEFFMGTKISGPLVKYSGKTAIQINSANEGQPPSRQYRMQFEFEPSFNILNYGYIEMDYSCALPLTGNISLFTEDDDDAERWEKTVINMSGPTEGQVQIKIGKALWGISRELRAIEIWQDSLADNPPIYITRMEFTGKPDPEDVEPTGSGEEIPATGVFLVKGASAVSGSPPVTPAVQSLNVTPGTTGTDFLYVHFDPLGEDFYAVRMDFVWKEWAGGNFSHRGGYDAQNTKRDVGGMGYAGYKTGEFNILYIAAAAFPANLNPSTVKCFVFEISEENGLSPNELEIKGVTFILGAPPPASVDLVIYNGEAALPAGMTWNNQTTATHAVIDNNKIKISAAPNSQFRMGFNFSPEIDLSGYSKLKITWEADPARTTLPAGNIMTSGGFDSIWDTAKPGPTSEFTISGVPGLSYLQYWSDAVSGINALYVSKIWFEP